MNESRPTPVTGMTLPTVAACLAASMDGRIAHPEIANLGSPVDRRHLEFLRAQADVLLYGAGTARADSRRRIEFRHRDVARTPTGAGRPVPPIVVVCRRPDFDYTSPFWASATRKALLHIRTSPGVTRPAGLPSDIGYLPVPAERSTPGLGSVGGIEAALRVLTGWVGGPSQGRSHVRVLCEGGGQLLGSLLGSGLVDEVHLTLTGWVVGGSRTPWFVSGELTPLRLELIRVHVQNDTSEVFLCYRRQGASAWLRWEQR